MSRKFPLQVTKNTLVDYPRLQILADKIEATKHLGGDAAEVGVYKGGTAYLLANHKGLLQDLFLFDTFNGMPPVKDIDRHLEGDFNDTSVEMVSQLLSQMTNVHIYKGIFPRQNSEYVDFRQFSFVHLDVDIYDSVTECLAFFTPRMVKGGVILLDDYLEPNCPGAKLATDEFCAVNGLTVTPTTQSQAIIQF